MRIEIGSIGIVRFAVEGGNHEERQAGFARHRPGRGLPAPETLRIVPLFLETEILGHQGSTRRCRAGAIARMDAAGIDMQVLSHVEPGVQFLDDPELAISLSREINDWLHEVVRTYPSRFAGFAMIPTQSPKDAADELERCVTEMGFVGALVNGHTNGRYLDHESYSVLFDRAEALMCLFTFIPRILRRRMAYCGARGEGGLRSPSS